MVWVEGDQHASVHSCSYHVTREEEEGEGEEEEEEEEKEKGGGGGKERVRGSVGEV